MIVKVMSENHTKPTDNIGLKGETMENMSQIDEKKQKRRSRKIPKSVRPEEFRALIEKVKPKDMNAKIGFLLAYASGLRLSEVLRCDKEHFRGNSLFIPESKYGVERTVPRPKGWRDDFNKFLPLKTTARTLERKFKKYSALASLAPIYTFHSLRHGFATRCLESGIPLNQVQVLLGHANIATTSVYTKANPIDALRNYEELF